MTFPIVVMGPSGCGKSTLARLLADALDRPFVEGDGLHPPTNRVKMARGIALSDADRAPFLDAVASALAAWPVPIASCSALKRAYRDRLRAAAPGVFFVLPELPRHELLRRVTERSGHFMPPGQVDDQIATLEALEPDEFGLTVNGMSRPEDQLRSALAALT